MLLQLLNLAREFLHVYGKGKILRPCCDISLLRLLQKLRGHGGNLQNCSFVLHHCLVKRVDGFLLIGWECRVGHMPCQGNRWNL